MSQIDWPTLVRWIIEGAVAFVFGLVGGWVAHHLARKRDDIAWQHREEELEKQFQHDRAMLELEFQKRLRKEPDQMAFLINVKVGQQYPLLAETYIGLDVNNNIVIGDSSTSSPHAKIRLEEGRFVVYNISGSARVNGKPFRKTMLYDADSVEIGGHLLVFKRL